MGPVNNPKLERTPKFTMAIRQPAMITATGVKYQGMWREEAVVIWKF